MPDVMEVVVEKEKEGDEIEVISGPMSIRVSSADGRAEDLVLQYFRQFKLTDPGTLLNLVFWARARHLEVEMEIRGWWPRAIAWRLFAYLYMRNEEVRRSTPVVRWEK